MRRTIIKQIKKFLITLMCGAFLLVNETVAFAATEAVYEDDVERWENNVYRGIVNTDDLNVRSAAGKNNPVVQVNGKGVTLNKQDEVAILDEALSSGEKWYKVSFRRDETLVVGYVHSYYVELTTDVLGAETVASTTTEADYKNVLTPLPSSDPSSTSAGLTTESQGEKRSRVGEVISTVIGAVITLFLLGKLVDFIEELKENRESKKEKMQEKSGTSDGYTSTSSSSSDYGVFRNSDAYRQAYDKAMALLSDNGGSSSSSYGYSEPFHASSYVIDHCSDYRLGYVSSEDQEIIKNDPSLTSEQKEEALRELEYWSHMWY